MTASVTLLVLSSKDYGASSPLILYPKEESGSQCLLILDLKPRSAGLKMGSIIGSEFPVYYETKPGEPLWRIEYFADDPATDQVNETINVFINNYDKKAFAMLLSDNQLYNKYLRNEIVAEILISIIEHIRVNDPDFNCLESAEEGSVAQLINYHIRSNQIDIENMDTVSKTVRKLMCNSK